MEGLQILKMLTYFQGGGLEMLTVADMGEGGVKIGQKSADVLYGRPLNIFAKCIVP